MHCVFSLNVCWPAVADTLVTLVNFAVKYNFRRKENDAEVNSLCILSSQLNARLWAHTPCPEKSATMLLSLTFANVDRFPKLSLTDLAVS